MRLVASICSHYFNVLSILITIVTPLSSVTNRDTSRRGVFSNSAALSEDGFGIDVGLYSAFGCCRVFQIVEISCSVGSKV